ncbi:hypothetical protein BH10ACI3_BH10ACI3_08040 [soil metagenome]
MQTYVTDTFLRVETADFRRTFGTGYWGAPPNPTLRSGLISLVPPALHLSESMGHHKFEEKS